MDREYSGRLLRNFQVDFLKDILNRFFETTTKFNKTWKESFKENGWLKASDIIEKHEVFSNSTNLQKLEDILYHELIDNVPDHIHVFPISLRGKTTDKVIEQLSTKQLPFDLKINRRIEDPSSFQIVNVKKTNSKVTFLFRLGLTTDEENKKVVFMIPCILDFDNHLVQIRFKQTLKSKSSLTTKQILTKVLNAIQELNVLDVLYLNPSTVKSIYFNMYKNESERAEEIIKNRAGISNTDEKQTAAEKFIKDTFGITEENSAYFDTYALKMMSIYYHKCALEMTDANFGDRFMFAFSFYDGYATRSSTRNSDKTHVYTGNLYWTLKDLILKKESLSSISMFYKFNPNDFSLVGGNNTIGVEVNIKESISLKENKAGFLIEFLNTNHKRRDAQRGVKSEYVISEIKRYIPTSPDV